jgi:2-polyprenyl-3-methyl-5-hydroxy-6-metoxy-1,4-benzoquinol methylase
MFVADQRSAALERGLELASAAWSRERRRVDAGMNAITTTAKGCVSTAPEMTPPLHRRRNGNAMNSLRNAENCPFCASAVLRRYSVLTNDDAIGPRPVQVIECRTCLTAWQWPDSFSQDDAKAYYATQYGNSNSGYFDSLFKAKVCAIEFEFLKKNTSKKGTLLDIGAGAGVFVQHAILNGWKAQGVDLSFSSEHVTKGTVDDITGCFDVVTMWDVIEHVEDPHHVIQQAVDKLADDGLLILETGNYLSAERILNEENWWAFNPDHRWYHAPGTVETILRKCGLRQFEYADSNLRPDAKRPAPYQGPSLGHFALRAVKRPHRLARYIRQYQDLKSCSQRLPRLGNIGIFAVAARR